MPTEKEIIDLAGELETQFANQRDADKQALRILTQSHIVEMQKDDKRLTKPVGSGFGALVSKQNFSFLATIPFVRFNAPDERQVTHAEMLESANQGLWKLSGAVLAWLEGIRDVVYSGRGWMRVLPAPQLWATDEFDRKKGESDGDYLQRIRDLKLRHFPIIAQHVDMRSCWPTFDERRRVDSVVSLGEMTVREANRRYGLNIGRNDSEKVKVIDYADQKMAATVVSHRKTLGSEQAFGRKPWEHGMGVNPYVLMEAPLLPENDLGYRWAGTIFDLRHLVEEIDGALSDWRHNTKRQVHSQPVATLDLERRRSLQPDARKPDDFLDIAPDKLITLGLGEKLDDYAGSRTNPDIKEFLAVAMALTRDMAIRPALLGLLEGDDSGVKYNTGAQIAQKQFGPTIDYLIPSAEGVTERLFRSVPALSREFADVADADVIPIHFVDGDGVAHKLELSPKDVEGWWNRSQARIELAIPVNRHADIVTGRMAADPVSGLMDEETAMEQFAGIENPREIIRKRRLDRLRRAMDDALVKLVMDRALQLQAQPSTSPDILAQQFESLPPAIQQAIQQAAQQQGLPAPVPLPEARGEANRAQTGLPQNPSQTVATELSSGVGV